MAYSCDFPYNDFGHWLKSGFRFKVQKLTINGSFTCPNRDGSIGRGGCAFCNNKTFTPAYCQPTDSITQQLQEGKRFFSRKYPDMKYIAYFQAYTNTYAKLDTLKRRYEEALQVDDVVGIAIGTRPDCVDGPLLDYLESLARHTMVMVEYGIESANDDTLRRINRGHDFACSQRAINETARRGIITGGHVIIGLPGEDRKESIRQASLISATRLDILKIHQLQVTKDTQLGETYIQEPFPLYTVDEYSGLLAEYIGHLRPTLVLERFTSQSPKDLLIAPHWGLKNHEFTNLFVNYLRKHGMYQGMYCHDNDYIGGDKGDQSCNIP